MKISQKLILVNEIFGGVPSFKKIPDFLAGGKLPELMIDTGDRSIAAPSDYVTIFSYPSIFLVCKIFIEFIFLLNRCSNFAGNNPLYPASLKIIGHYLG